MKYRKERLGAMDTIMGQTRGGPLAPQRLVVLHPTFQGAPVIPSVLETKNAAVVNAKLHPTWVRLPSVLDLPFTINNNFS